MNKKKFNKSIFGEKTKTELLSEPCQLTEHMHLQTLNSIISWAKWENPQEKPTP